VRREPTLLALVVAVLLLTFSGFMIGLTVWVSAATREAIEHLPVLQAPSPTKVPWLDRLHEREDRR
jgi:hypothetical protein